MGKKNMSYSKKKIKTIAEYCVERNSYGKKYKR